MRTAMSCRSALVLAFTLVVTTCSSEPATFYNPRTGEVSQCQSSNFDPYGDKCVATYESSGWLKYDKPIIDRETPPRITSP
jgi:photosystem II stability/assembly factor-like uncharacterized protein